MKILSPILDRKVAGAYELVDLVSELQVGDRFCSERLDGVDLRLERPILSLRWDHLHVLGTHPSHIGPLEDRFMCRSECNPETKIIESFATRIILDRESAGSTDDGFRGLQSTLSATNPTRKESRSDPPHLS